METLWASSMQISLVKSLHTNAITVTLLGTDICAQAEKSKCCSNFRVPFDLKQQYYLHISPRILKANERPKPVKHITVLITDEILDTVYPPKFQ